ncbi:hypothetical protein [Sulfitobacter sp. JB4-11]|uniref:hypothetical protein n=1 Tax=Sulfitobacter rhodophyticola TaxID=3238304 RepID=UPI003513057E
MGYQATATRTAGFETTRHLLHRLGHGFGAFGRALMENCDGNRRLRQVQALQAKTDAELAALNIDRDRIVERVFGQTF